MFSGYMAASTTPPTTCPTNPFSDSGSITTTGQLDSSGNLGWSTGFCGNSDGIECNAYSGYDDWVCADLVTGEAVVSIQTSNSVRGGYGLRTHSRLAPTKPPMGLTNALSHLWTRMPKNCYHTLHAATLRLLAVKITTI